MRDVDVAEAIIEGLNGVCPNCDGPLERRNTWSIRCRNCQYYFSFETPRYRAFMWAFTGGVLVFALGYIIGVLI